MKTKQATQLGEQIAELVRAKQPKKAYALLAPVLAERTPFDTLRRIAQPVGAESLGASNSFLDLVAADRTEGGWVVIAKVMEGQLERDLASALARCRDFVAAADVWHGVDTLGEGVIGQALVAHFEPALDLLVPWRQDASPWVRRAVGTGVHFWAKRSRGAAEHAPQAERLLAFLEPMFGEWDMITVKGVGWGLKTLGRHYPNLVTDWLATRVVPSQPRHRALMLRKALTYLSDAQRARATGGEAG